MAGRNGDAYLDDDALEKLHVAALVLRQLEKRFTSILEEILDVLLAPLKQS